MAEDRIDSVIDIISVEAEVAKVSKLVTDLGLTLKSFPKATVFSDASNVKDISIANKQLSSTLDQLKVKNAELTVALKEQKLAEVELAAQKKISLQAAKDQAAAEKELSKQAQIAGSEKIRALKAQQKAEEELAASVEARNKAEEEYLGGGNKAAKIVKPAINEPEFTASNRSQSLILDLTQTQALLKENQTAQKLLTAQLDAGEISQGKYNEQIVIAKEQEIAYRKTITDTNAELKARTNLDSSVQGSIDAARAQNALLVQQRNAVPVGEGASEQDVAKLKSLNAEIDKNNELIDKNNDLLGRQKINIGNYPNAFGSAFKTLNTELDQVKNTLSSGDLKGESFDKLTAKLNVLQNAAGLTGKEFATVGQQQKAYAEASTQIGLVYGKNSQVFKDFSSGVKEGNTNIKGLATEITSVATKGKGFVSFLSAAWNGIRKLAYVIPGLGIGGAVLLLIGPFQAAGAAIIKWSSNATAGGRASEDFKRNVDELNIVMKEAVNDFGNATKNVLQLKEDVKLAKEGFIDKNNVLKEYNETMGKTTGQLKTLDEVEIKIVKDGQAYIDMMFLKAEAAASYAEAAKQAQKSVTSQADAEKDFGNSLTGSLNAIVSNRNNLSFGQKLRAAFDPFSPEALADQGLAAAGQIKKDAKKIQNEAKKSFDDYTKMGDDFRRRSAIIAKGLGGDILGNDSEKSKSASKKSLQALQDQLNTEFEIYKIAQQRKIGEFSKEVTSDNNYYLEKLSALDNFVKASNELNKRQEVNDIANAQRDSERKIQKLNEDKVGATSNQSARINQNIKTEQFNLQQSINLIKARGADDSIKIAEDSSVKRQKIVQDELKREAELDAEYQKIISDQDAAGDKRIEEGYQKRIEQEKEAVKTLIELEKQLRDAKENFALDAENSLFNIGEGAFERARNQNDAQLQLIDEKSKKEIDAINASGLAEEEKTRRVTAIQKQADFAKQQIEDRQKKQDINRAKFERAQQLFEITMQTVKAVAAIKAQAAILLSNPLTAGYAAVALSQIPFTIASGAIAAAAILASPLPHFKTGTKNAPRGHAVVGEEGSELMLNKQGQMFLTPSRPTLVDLAGGEQIFKHDITRDMLSHMNLLNILQKVHDVKRPEKVDNVYNEKIYRELRTLNGKPPFVIKVQNGMETSDYYRRNIKN